MAKVTSIRRTLSDAVDPPSFVGGLFPRQQLSVIAAAAGTGKTWTVVKQALDLSIGNPVFLSPDDEPYEPCKTVIICGETGPQIMNERRRLLNQLYDPDKVIVYYLADFVEHNTQLYLDTEQGLRILNDIIREEKPDIFYIDTLISFRQSDESDSPLTAFMLNGIRNIANRFNCAGVLMHHVRKRKLAEQAATSTQDEIIGSSALSRLCSCAYILQQSFLGETISFFCVKSWFEKPAPVSFVIMPTDDGFVRLEYRQIAETDDTAAAIEWITDLQPNSNFSWQELAQAVNIGRSLAYKVIKHCLSENVIKLAFINNRIRYYEKV